MYKRKYIVLGRQAYLSYVMFTFPFYYYAYSNKKAGKTHTHTPVSYTHLPIVINFLLIHVPVQLASPNKINFATSTF